MPAHKSYQPNAQKQLNKLVMLGATLCLILVGVASTIIPAQTFADEVEELQREIDKLSEQKSQSEAATQNLEKAVHSLNTQINYTRYNITVKKSQSEQLADSIEDTKTSLTTKIALLHKLVADQYKAKALLNPALTLVSSHSATNLLRGMSHQFAVSNFMSDQVGSLATDISELDQKRQSLLVEAQKLESTTQDLSQQAGFFSGEISKAKEFQSVLGSKIAELSAKQQAIISARSGAATTNATNVPDSGDYDATLAGFLDKAPGGSFAVFSFGGYTHRKGMSQYGAKARADAGQDYEEILNEYYGKKPVKVDTGGSISVAGYGNLDFEDYYLLGIAEMPSSWPLEALKAQAVAARTYAYRYKRDERTICTTEACQVFNNSKAANSPSKWKQAVKETKGMILEDVVTYYAAMSGGYVSPLGWDTTDGKGGSGDWTKNAWEVKADAPWFYKSWYRSGYSDSSASCGRKPWLTEEEMADILNAYLLRQDSDGADMNRLVPVTIRDCPVGGQSGNPYSMSELRSLLDDPITSISGKPEVTNDSSANTLSVKFSTNRGSVKMTGKEFKEIFNTRAPGYLRIPQSRFAFFNIEKK